MKKLLYLTLLLGLLTTSASASHLMGGELRYESDGTSYTVYLKLYRDCSGVTLPVTAALNYSSVSSSVNTSIAMQRISLEDASPQCAFVNQCLNPSATLPGFQVATYRVVLTLPNTASDWVFSFNAGARTAMNNITSSANLYLEAKLDNTNGYNSNPFTPGEPPLLLPTNNTINAPLYTIDPDGDSVVFTRIAPMIAANTSVTYSAGGYSATAPFGSGGTYTLSGNGVNESIALKSTTMGKFALAYNVSEYRNGTFIGSHIRDFAVLSLAGGSAFTYPTLTNNLRMQVYTCPGSQDTSDFSFVDPTSTDSVFIKIDTPALSGWNFKTFVQNAKPFASGQVSWTAPSNLNPLTLPYFFITVNVYDNGCPRAATKYPVLVKTRACSADSVWPGDANNDNVVNLLDPLAIALAYNSTGPVRPNATNNWVRQYAPDWSGNIGLTTVNKKYADCDGNGTVGASDLVPVAANWGQTHPKDGPRNKTTGLPDLYFDISGILFQAGGTVSVPIMFGSTADPMDDLYGLASRISVTVDGAVPSAQATITTATTWVGTASNTLTFNKDLDNGTIDWALARTDQQSAGSNQGQIAMLNFTVPSSAKYGDIVSFKFMSPTVIDKDGKVITDYNAVDATGQVGIPESIAGVSGGIAKIDVVPNPSGKQASLQLTLNKAQSLTITVTDITGKQVWTANQDFNKGHGAVALPASTLANGMYMINVTGEDVSTTLKWMKH